MKITGIILIELSIFILGLDIYNGILGSYEYDKKYASYWDLADKSSTIQKKSEGIDKFVLALENSPMKGEYNAISLTTPNNSFDYNFEALKSLQLRLHQIDTMNIASFQYQTAIQQITQQEQGEAHEMLSVFKGIWWKQNHFLLWDWVGTIQVISFVVLLLIGTLLLLFCEDYL